MSLISALEKVAQTGNFDPSESSLGWPAIIEKIQEQLEGIVKSNFTPSGLTSFEEYRYIDPLTKESFSIQNLVENINQKLKNGFPDSPPFTIQRLAELIINPTALYPSDQPQKFLSALERVLSVSSNVEDFEKLDTEELIKESQINQKQTDENESMGDDEDINSLKNGGSKSPSLLSQATSVVVMSPIPWATAAMLEQHQDLDEDVPMLENEPVLESFDSESVVDHPSNENELLVNQTAESDMTFTNRQRSENQLSKESHFSTDISLSTQPEKQAWLADHSPESLEDNSKSNENKLEDKSLLASGGQSSEAKQNSSDKLISDEKDSVTKIALLEEKPPLTDDQTLNTTSWSFESNHQSDKSLSSEKDDQHFEKLNRLNTSKVDDSAPVIKLTESNSSVESTSSVDIKETEISTIETSSCAENSSPENEVHDAHDKSEMLPSLKDDKRKELDEVELETKETDSNSPEATGFLGEKRRKLSEEPDES